MCHTITNGSQNQKEHKLPARIHVVDRIVAHIGIGVEAVGLLGEAEERIFVEEATYSQAIVARPQEEQAGDCLLAGEAEWRRCITI